MKLSTIKPLVEGIRFGQKQISQLKRDDILIGIEYEFDIDEEVMEEIAEKYDIDGSGISEEERDEWMHEFIYEKREEEKGEAREEFIDSEKDHYLYELGAEEHLEDLYALAKADITTGMDLVTSIKDEEENRKEHLDELYAWWSSYNKNEYHWNAIRDWSYLEDTMHLFNDLGASDLDQFKDNIDNFDEIGDVLDKGLDTFLNSEEARDELYEAINQVDDMIDSIHALGNKTLESRGNDLEREAIDHVVSSWDDWGSDDWEENHPYEDYYFDAYDAYSEGHGDIDEGGKVGFFTQLISKKNEYNLKEEDFENITTDSSVPDGIEAITKPLPMDEAFEVMKNMFAFIDVIGDTTSSTGMHTNMSIKGKSFTESDFNPLKLLLLSNEEHIQGEDKWPARNYVGSILEEMNQDKLIDILEEMGDDVKKINTMAGRERLAEVFSENIIGKAVKGKSINMAYTKLIGRGRVEFRALGGAKYHKRYDELKWDIQRLAYMMEVSFDKEFGKKEYLEEVWDVLDSIAIKKTDYNSFNEFVKAYMSGSLEGTKNAEIKASSYYILARNKTTGLIGIINNNTGKWYRTSGSKSGAVGGYYDPKRWEEIERFRDYKDAVAEAYDLNESDRLKPLKIFYSRSKKSVIVVNTVDKVFWKVIRPEQIDMFHDFDFKDLKKEHMSRNHYEFKVAVRTKLQAKDLILALLQGKYIKIKGK